MKKTIILSSIIFLLFSCKYFRGDSCNNTIPIIGTYKNIYDKNAENLLIIIEDGTFYQKFTKDDIVTENTGTWKIFKESCNVIFVNLKLLHNLPLNEKKLFRDTGLYRLNKIMFVEDLRTEFDFYRDEIE